jgi:dolichol-phosphate mannosyltransferase
MFSLVIPVYNEAENIKKLITEIDHSLVSYNDYEIIFVNDCSFDDTNKVLKSIKNNYLRVINNKDRLGQSKSIKKGIQSSIYNTIITIDGDGQNNPKDIPELLNLYLTKNKNCLVAGIRKKRKDSVVKIISSFIANYLREKIFKDGCKDTGCSLKIFNKNTFLDFPFFNGIHRFLPSLYVGFNYDVYYISVDHRMREKGNSNYGTFDRLYRGIIDIFKVKKIISNNKKNNAKL